MNTTKAGPRGETPDPYLAAVECPECQYWPVYTMIADPLDIDDPVCPGCGRTFQIVYDDGADSLLDMFAAALLRDEAPE